VFDFMGDEQLNYKLEETLAADAQLIGRTTYESFAGAWPQREGPMAEKINSMTKYVVTSSPDTLGWANCVAVDGTGDVPAAIREIKAGDGGEILVAGSRQLVHTLLLSDLVDELRLMVFPVVLGSGARPFPESPDKLTLELADTRAFQTGVQVHTYRPAG